MRGLLALMVLGACVMAAPLRARAADPTSMRVVLVARGSDLFLERVGAEVEAIGFQVVHSDAGGPLEAIARKLGAAAALRILPSGKGVEVWMADATSGRSLLRQVVVDESPGGPDRDLIALQTAELLRTSLLGEKPASDRTSQTPAAGSTAAQDDRGPGNAADGGEPADGSAGGQTSLHIGVGALFSPGGGSASAMLGLSLQHVFEGGLGLGIDLAMPVASGSLDQPEGSATLSPYAAGAALLLRLTPERRPFLAHVGAGAAFLLLRYEGKASDPLQASSGSHATAAAYARADIGVAPAPWLHLGLAGMAGASFERITIRFAGNDAGTYGPALLACWAFAGLAW